MKSVRQQAKERDGYRCLACNSTNNLTIDHIYPKSMGGANSLENFQTLCQPCNGRKDNEIVDFIGMPVVQKRLWLLEKFGEDWRIRLAELNGEDAYKPRR